jgi:isopenicillin N synthase-like dioxygenase
MVNSWRKDGIFQISMNSSQQHTFDEAFPTGQAYFSLPFAEKARNVDSQSFAGYIASGEELTDGIADYSEICTITKDLPPSDPRVQARWPCHGPCPWPNRSYEAIMKKLMNHLGESGDKLLKLAALGLGLKNKDFFSDLTEDGWHHMRVLR